MPGTESIREMVRVLEAAEGSLRDRVVLAARAWWRAVQYRDHWPDELRGRADCISERLSRHEPLARSAVVMSGDDLCQVAADLIAFAEDAGIQPRENHRRRLSPAHFYNRVW